MTDILWTEPAVADLAAIHAYIARDADTYADALILDILEAVDRLREFPKSGRVIPEIRDDASREIIVGNYRIMYDLGPSVIRILTVVHGARQFPGSD